MKRRITALLPTPASPRSNTTRPAPRHSPCPNTPNCASTDSRLQHLHGRPDASLPLAYHCTDTTARAGKSKIRARADQR